MKIILILFIATCLLSCSDNNNRYPRYNAYCEACGVVGPQDNLAWLNEKIIESETLSTMFTVYVTHYKGKDVILTLHSSVVTFDDMYDCQGNMIKLTIEEREEVVKEKRKWVCIYDFMQRKL